MNVSFYAIARLQADFQVVTEWGCDTSRLRTKQDADVCRPPGSPTWAGISAKSAIALYITYLISGPPLLEYEFTHFHICDSVTKL